MTTGPTRPATDPEPGDDDGSAPSVLGVQERLTALGFWLGPVDGRSGALTTQAVLAFQKAEGLGPDGVAGPATLAHLDDAITPAPRHTTGDGLEIDLDRQILLVVVGGDTRWVLNTSTGTSATPTPPGGFRVFRHVDGPDPAPLGTLYRPAYFNGGIAVHGSPSIPAGPASHGCARLSDPAMDLLWSLGMARVGTTVWVY